LKDLFTEKYLTLLGLVLRKFTSLILSDRVFQDLLIG